VPFEAAAPQERRNIPELYTLCLEGPLFFVKGTGCARSDTSKKKHEKQKKMI